jgi:hypothetical protein
MKNIILLMVFMLLISNTTFSQENDVQDTFNIEKFNSDVEIIKSKADSAFKTGGNIIQMWKKEIKMVGLKETIKLNAFIFLPLAIFLTLFLIWLKGNKKSK